MALLDAGERPDETVSVPREKAQKLELVATADPFDEPEAYAAAKYSLL
jgi:hypothetical protein